VSGCTAMTLRRSAVAVFHTIHCTQQKRQFAHRTCTYVLNTRFLDYISTQYAGLTILCHKLACRAPVCSMQCETDGTVLCMQPTIMKQQRYNHHECITMTCHTQYYPFTSRKKTAVSQSK